MAENKRQLAAIMFTDIVGYTRLMGEDEQKAMQVLRQNRRIHQSVIKKYQGNWLKEMGDGTLASFKTTSDAVYCAGELMQKCKAEEIILRIGMHQGEIVEVDGDIFGDGVNVASRLEPIADPGQILVSGPIHRNVKNKEGICTTFVREASLKNVDEVIKLYSAEVKLEEVTHADFEYVDEQTDIQDNSIAVLPFVNMSNDPEQEFFCDGITEEIINTIVQYPELKVAGRTSSFRFKGKNEDLRIIGKTLGVRKVLEGSIRKSGNNIRITAQLVETSSGFHLWSQKYDRMLNDVFVIQDEIAADIGKHLKLSLYSEYSKPKTRKHTENFDAYQMYFKGRSFYYERGQSLYKALECFKEALKIDPDYAMANSGLADTYIMFIWHGQISPSEAWPLALSYAQKALKFGADLSEIHNTWAVISLLYENKWEIARKAFEKALELNPGYTQARCWFGLFYLSTLYKRLEEGIQQTKIAIEKDPLSSYAYAVHSLALSQAGKFKEAISSGEYGVKLHPDTLVGRYALGYAYLYGNETEKAEQEFLSGLAISPYHSWCTYLLTISYVRNNKREEAQELYEQLKKKAIETYVQPTQLFLCAAALGHELAAIKYAQQALDTKDPHIYFVLNSCEIQLVKDMNGIDAILEQMDYIAPK